MVRRELRIRAARPSIKVEADDAAAARSGVFIRNRIVGNLGEAAMPSWELLPQVDAFRMPGAIGMSRLDRHGQSSLVSLVM